MASGNQQLGFAIRAVNEAGAAMRAIQGDLSGVEKRAEAADKAFGGLHGALGKAGSAMFDVAKIAGGFVIAQGFLKLPGLLADAARAAADDEQSTARLAATIRSLGGDFDAQMKDVQAAIASGQKLAFSDDEVRDSFDKLAQATGDSSEALQRQRLAMDLARGANIPLADASKLLGKVTDENLQVFKRMGITLPDVANEADVLAAVQKKFAGQADAYARSTAGQFEQVKIRMSELKETAGAVLLPVMAKLGDVLVTRVVPAIESLAGLVGPLASAGWDKISGPLTDLAGLAWGGMQAAWSVIQPLLEKAAVYTWGALADLAGLAWGGMQAAWSVIQPLLEKAAAYTWGALADLANASWDAMRDALSAAVAQLEKIPSDKIRTQATDTSNWAAAWANVRSAIQPAVDALLPRVQDLLVGMKANLREVQDSLRRFGEAFGELAKAVQPLQPLIEPLAKLLGGALVVAIAADIEALKILAGIFTLSIVASIETATLAIRGITKALEFVTAAVTDWGPALGRAFGDVWKVVAANVALIVEKIGEIASGARGFVVDMYDAGVALIQGIWNGMMSKWTEVTGWIRHNLNPRNWDIPGFSPLPEAMKEGGGEAGDYFASYFYNTLTSKWERLVKPAIAAMVASSITAFTAAGIAPPTVDAHGNWTALPPWAGMSTIPSASNLVNQYIGGGRFGLVPQFGVSQLDKFGSTFVTGGSQSYDPSLPNYVPSASANRIPDYIRGFAHGSDFVPNDGLAYLHRGEAVVPAAENRGREQSITINLTLDGEVIDRRVVKVIDGQLTTEAMQYGVRVG